MARVEEKRGAHCVLVGKTEGKRQLARPGCRQEDNIAMDFNSVDWIVLAQVRGKSQAALAPY
jgi:hypothetical protein